MLDRDLGRFLDLLDDEVALTASHDAGDVHVLVAGDDDEAPRVVAHRFVGFAPQLDPVQAVEVAALAHELDAEHVALVAEVEGARNVLDPLVELPKERFVPGDPLLARRHRSILYEFRPRGGWKTRPVESSVERAAANEARFREANERIREKALELGGREEPSPYLCECDVRDCTTVILLTAQQYEDVRSDSRRFVVASGHQNPDDRVLGEHGAFTVIEKTGEEGRLVEELDPRSRS